MMNETTSKTDSSLVLWGEIQPNCNPFDATNLWKPINEYQNINLNYEGKINKNILHSDNRDLSVEDEDDINYDPIGSHIIALRNYYFYLNEQAEQEKRKAAERLKKGEKRKSRNVYFAPPKAPQNYPFSRSFEITSLKPKNMTTKCSNEIPKYLLEKKRTIFIKNVLQQAGVFDIEDEETILNYLSTILNEFLQKFVTLLSHNKNSEPFSKDEDLWNALETTLRNFGMGGISGLHEFYFENVVKKHDILDRKCKDLYKSLQRSK